MTDSPIPAFEYIRHEITGEQYQERATWIHVYVKHISKGEMRITKFIDNESLDKIPDLEDYIKRHWIAAWNKNDEGGKL